VFPWLNPIWWQENDLIRGFFMRFHRIPFGHFQLPEDLDILEKIFSNFIVLI
jgi:hypothetical protein